MPWLAHNVQLAETDASSKPQQNCQQTQNLYCTTNCIAIALIFQENCITNTHVWNNLSHRNDRRQRGVIWITYGCYAGNPYQFRNNIHRRSSVPPRAWAGPTTTDRNRTQLRNQRPQHHDDLWLSNSTTPGDGHSVMGNLREPLNFPLVWTRKGAVEPRRSNWYCAARFTCWEGNFAPWSQSTACRVVSSFRYLKAVTVILVRRGPIPGRSHVLGVLGVTCEWLLWRAYKLGYFKPGELEELCRPKVVRLCGWLVR